MMVKKINFLIAVWLMSIQLIGQTSEFLNKQAEGYYNNKQFFKARFIYQQLLQDQPENQQLILRRAICEYETNHLDSAEHFVKYLLFNSRKDLDVIHYLYGKILMSKGEYPAAVSQLKKSLNYASNEEMYREFIISDIKRCGSAINLFSATQAILIEPAGPEVNTEWDEVNPVPSINMDSRFYFNSNREISGTSGNAAAGYELPYDMYGSSLQNGEWSDIYSLNSSLVTKNHELLSDFNENGQILYFKQGVKLDSLTFITDTFSQEDQKSRTGILNIPFLKGTEDLHFFTNDILLFSSDQLGGMGGFDLFYTLRSPTGWTIPVNLGNEINTPFDEISPFLAFDGRTIFYSSNNLYSIGGFDVFNSTFDDKSKKWSTPINMGIPFNSSEDEKNFRLNKNRLSGLYASNRKSGIGGFDIYFAYFRQAWSPQLERSRPIFFGSYNEILPATVQNVNPISVPAQGVIPLDKPIIYYESEEQLSLSAVTKTLDIISANLKNHQAVHLIIEAFSDQTGLASQDLLFSIRRAEIIKSYLTSQGIKPSRIIVKGYGANFPVAKEVLNTVTNPAGKSLNRRIECTYFIADPLLQDKLVISTQQEPISPLFIDESLSDFRKSELQLNYKILLVSAVSPSNLETYIPNYSVGYFVEKNNTNGRYELMSKGFPDFESALKARKNKIANGFEDAIILAYSGNQRIANNFMTKWSDKYPDLLKYIYRSE